MQNSFKKFELSEVDKIEEIVEVLSEAFYNHKNFTYLIENEKVRKKSLKYLFTFMVRVLNKNGYIYVIYQENNIVGCINYMDDNLHKMNLISIIMAKGGIDLIKFLLLLRVKSVFSFTKYMMVYRSLPHTDKGTIHLYSTGIQPKLKGQGLMSDPFKNSFLYFKNLGYQKVALETSDYSNVGLYEHIGFKLVFTKKSKDERQEIFYFEKVL